METIAENSILLNWNDGDASVNPTPGDTTKITTKDNYELMMDNSTTYESNTNEDEYSDSEATTTSSPHPSLQLSNQATMKSNMSTETQSVSEKL